MGKQWKQGETTFLGSKIAADGDYSHETKRHLLLERKTMTNLDSILKSRDVTLSTKAHLVKAMVFSSSHVWMWELDYKESWAPKNRCFWTLVLEKTVESPLDYKEIQPDHPKGDQSWVFIGRTDAEAEAPILWPPDAKKWLIWKNPDAGKDWGQGEKGTTEDEMVGWHHRLNGHASKQTLEDFEGQGNLVCYRPWDFPGKSTGGGAIAFSIQSLSCVQFFATPWTAACQASLTIINFRNLLKLMSIESVMPTNHLIIYCPLLLLPSIFSSIGVFSNESVLHIR